MYEDIVFQQTAISIRSEGAISINDTDEMSPFERQKILESLDKIDEQRKEAIEKSKRSKRM